MERQSTNQFNPRGISRFFVGEQSLWVVVMLLMLISAVVVFSATSSMAFRVESRGGTFYSVYGSHLLHMFVSFVVMVIVSNIPTKFFRQYALLLLIISIALLAWVMIGGATIQGAKRYLSVGGMSFQPSEVARFALINYVAATLRKKDGVYNSPKTLLKVLLASGAVVGLIMINNNSTAMLLGLTIFAMLVMGGANRRWMGRMVLAGVAAIILLVVVLTFIPQAREIGRLGTLVSRIEDFRKQSGGAPINNITFSDTRGEDQQLVASQQAIANSRLVGVGSGNSELREILPEAYSDFIFSIIWEEYGIIGAIVIIGVYIFFFFTVGRIARWTRSVYKSLLIMGLATIITLQAILHMMVCTNLFPITGQNLPFISRGGTSYMVTAAYFGVILAVSHENRRDERRRSLDASGLKTEVEPEFIPEFDE